MFVAALLAQAAAAQPVTPVQPPVARLAALYDQVCLRTFPDDAAVDALMPTLGARALTPEEVKVTLRDDPGRGWAITEGERTYLVILELPPFHACSVRAGVGSDPIDLAPYRAVLATFKATRPPFKAEKPMDATQGPLRMHAESERRVMPDGSAEALMIIDQQITDPTRRANGETGTMLRFVRQIAGGR